MPIIDLGYRAWEGTRSHPGLRWLTIAQTSASLVWRSAWVRRILTFGWLPVFVTMFALFLFELSSGDMRFRSVAVELFRDPLNRPDLASEIARDPQVARPHVWSHLLLTLFRYPQAVVLVILVGMVAPRLISYDLRSRAYLLYFSRPLSPAEYLLGKAAVVWFVSALLTAVPALAVYAGALMLSDDTTAFLQTWDLPLRVLAATVLLAIPMSAVALCFSSLTTDSRYAAFAWYAFWILGWVSYGALTSTELMGEVPEVDFDAFRLLSPYHSLGQLQDWVFGSLRPGESVTATLLVVGLVTSIASAVTYWRIAGQLRI